MSCKSGCALQSTYALKAIVVALSSFKDLLFLDSDSFALYNPAVFFEHKRYAATGAILWQDFWDADWAPDAPAVLGIDADAMPAYTLESGQMVLDKGRRVALPVELHAVACRRAVLIATWADAYGLETCTLSAGHATRRTLAAPCV